MNDVYLVHYGVKGMKWGVRHDYVPVGRDGKPLSDEERKARRNKYLKIGAGVATGLLLTYGGYKLLGSEAGQRMMANQFHKLDVKMDRIIEWANDEPKAGSISKTIESMVAKNPGKATKNVDMQMIKSINPNYGTANYDTNCAHCSLSYVLNSLFGQKTSALPMRSVDEASGLVMTGREPAVYNSIFNNINRIKNNSGKSFSDSLNDLLPDKSTSILYLDGEGGLKHLLCAERSGKNITIIDPQIDHTFDLNNEIEFKNLYDKVYNLLEIFDLSNASIKTDAINVINNMVK